MYSDRELLELAARAAGMKIHTKNQAERDEMGFGHKGMWIVGGSSGWNPLTDDGDALRLAVRLGLQVSVTTESCRAETLPRLGVRVNDKDELSATRRAIVRAAAAIGEAMK
jgi:hypothetical protein